MSQVIQNIKSKLRSKPKLSISLRHFILVLRRLVSRLTFREPALDLYSKLRHLSKRRSTKGFYNYIKNSRRIRIVGSTASTLLVLLTLATLFPLYYKESSTAATVGTANLADTSLELVSAGSNTASATINITSSNGSFANSVDDGTEASFKVTSNNFTGYTLRLSPASGNTNTLASASGASFSTITDVDGVTATNFGQDSTTSAGLNGKWGIGYRDSNTASYGIYYPASSTITIGSTSSANATTSAYDTYYVGLGVRADYTQTAGDYSNSTSNNKYILTATGNAIPLKITFLRNDGTSNIFYTQNESVSTTSATLYATKPTRDHYSFINWCFGSVTTTNGVDSCTGTTYAPGATFNVDQTVDNQNIIMNAMWRIDTFTCTKQYRLQNADGSFPAAYTADGSEAVNYGGSCSYSKTMTDYKANGGANNSAVSASASNISANQTLSLDFYRNTFTLTVNAGTNTSSAKGSGTYRWGQGVAVSVTKATNVTCTSYAAPTWKVTSGSTGSFSSTSGISVTYTMPKGNSAVAANSTASAVAQTITFKTSNANGITLNGNYKTNNQTLSINCGTYNISGSYPDNYEFSSWSATAGSFANSASASTTYTVSGAATVTLTGKSSAPPDYCAINGIANANCMQKMAASNCTTTAKDVTDNRDGSVYKVQKLADNKCWMLDNLRLGSTNKITLTSSNSNTNGNYELPAGVTTLSSYTTAQINVAYKDDTTTGYGPGSKKVGVYYNYCAASAGTICTDSNSSNAQHDVCPKGWHMPTGDDPGEYRALYTAYSSNATNFRNALSTPLSGSFYIRSQQSLGSYGIFWSSTYSSSTASNMYILNVSSSTVSPNLGYGRNRGYSIRCVLK